MVPPEQCYTDILRKAGFTTTVDKTRTEQLITNMKEYLVVSVLGTDQPGIINKLSAVVNHHNCNIEDTRMAVLGGEFALLMLIQGDSKSVSSVARELPIKAEELGLTTQLKQTTPRTPKEASRPYQVRVVALDNPGIVKDIAGFFGEQSINIEEMHTSTYSAAHTGTQMFELNMVVNIPANTTISALKEQFIRFCDDRNLDATIEPKTQGS